LSQICSKCNFHNEKSAKYCSNCGKKLASEDKEKTIVFSTSGAGGVPTDRLDERVLMDPEPVGDSLFAFRFIKSSQILPLPGVGDYILGRISDGQTILPDIDLAPYDAFEAGVSRLHALLTITPKSVSITDLGSSNGTYLNREKLRHHIENSLSNKDLVQLGQLNMQALVQQKN
jgi:pSer/pThr/pTyr-binding forkhead associated (FHA) protein